MLVEQKVSNFASLLAQRSKYFQIEGLLAYLLATLHGTFYHFDNISTWLPKFYVTKNYYCLQRMAKYETTTWLVVFIFRGLNFKNGPLLFIFVPFKQLLNNKIVDFIGIQTRIVEFECNHADHLTSRIFNMQRPQKSKTFLSKIKFQIQQNCSRHRTETLTLLYFKIHLNFGLSSSNWLGLGSVYIDHVLFKMPFGLPHSVSYYRCHLRFLNTYIWM